MSLCELTDDEYFSNTEGLIVQLAAKECLLISETSPANDMLKKVGNSVLLVFHIILMSRGFSTYFVWFLGH